MHFRQSPGVVTCVSSVLAFSGCGDAAVPESPTPADLTPLTSLQLSLGQVWSASDRPLLESSLTRCLEDVVYLSALTENLWLACSLQEEAHPQTRGPLTEAGGALEAVCRRLQPLARRKGIVLDWARPDGEVLLQCSPIMLERVLANLNHNAIRYGGEGGHVIEGSKEASGSSRRK